MSCSSQILCWSRGEGRRVVVSYEFSIKFVQIKLTYTIKVWIGFVCKLISLNSYVWSRWEYSFVLCRSYNSSSSIILFYVCWYCNSKLLASKVSVFCCSEHCFATTDNSICIAMCYSIIFRSTYASLVSYNSNATCLSISICTYCIVV